MSVLNSTMTTNSSLVNMTTSAISTTLATINGSMTTNHSLNIPSTAVPTAPKANEVYDCKSFQYEFHKNIPLSVICGLCFLVGTIMVFIGYRAFRISMFIMGLSLTSLLTYLVLQDRTDLELKWIASIAGGAGLLCGALAAALPIIGLIIASIIQALFFMVITIFIVYIFTTKYTFWICVGTVIGLSIFFTGIMIARQRKAAIIYITSFGAILIMLALDYYLDLFMITRYAYHLIFLINERQPCWFSWTVFAVWPFLVVLGCVVQFLKTAKGYTHKKAKAKSKENKYKTDSTGRSRRLYDNGDVIAQAWIQTSEDTLEKRRSFTPVYDYESQDDQESTTLV